MSTTHIDGIESALPRSETTIAKDLRLNLQRLLTESTLTPEEGLTALVAVSSSVQYRALEEYASLKLKDLGMTEDLITGLVRAQPSWPCSTPITGSSTLLQKTRTTEARASG